MNVVTFKRTIHQNEQIKNKINKIKSCIVAQYSVIVLGYGLQSYYLCD